jgi:hypothetical protein
MSRKLLIGRYLMPLLLLTPLFIFAQEQQVAVSDYFFFYKRAMIFSLHPFFSGGSVSLFSQNQFLLKELCTATVSGYYHMNGNAVAFTVSHFGYSKYGIFTVSSGYAREFGQRVSFGMQAHYLLHHAEGYPQQSSFTLDLSLYGKVSQKVGIGASAYNFANLKYGISGNEKIPMLYTLMLDYKINDKVLLAIAASKKLPGFLDITGTIGYKDKFYGFMMDCSLKKVGILFSLWSKKLQFDAGGSFDYRLGFSPNVGIRYIFSTGVQRAQSNTEVKYLH